MTLPRRPHAGLLHLEPQHATCDQQPQYRLSVVFFRNHQNMAPSTPRGMPATRRPLVFDPTHKLWLPTNANASLPCIADAVVPNTMRLTRTELLAAAHAAVAAGPVVAVVCCTLPDSETMHNGLPRCWQHMCSTRHAWLHKRGTGV